MIMRDTVFTLSEGADEETIRASVEAMVKKVQTYVPGYRLKQKVQFERFGDNNRLKIPATASSPASRPRSSSRLRAQATICRAIRAISTS
jgi:acetaldehyde dehydrogenase (acetylating)